MKIIGILLCCLGVSCASAQNFRKDFIEVYNNYKNRSYYTQEVMVASYENKGEKKPIHLEKGKIVKGKEKYYSKFAGQETILDGKQFLFINHTEKRMTYYDEVNLDLNELTQVYQQGLDSVGQDRITYLGSTGIYKTYQIESPKEMIKITEIKLNMKNQMVEQVVYYYQPIGQYKSTIYKTVIDYHLLSEKEPPIDSFNWQKYITVKNNVAVLNKQYKQFNLTQREEREFKWGQLSKQ